ncbi:MAG: hypothetical protein ACE5OO_00665 [Candidatus Bathyarchaeia archaeon]
MSARFIRRQFPLFLTFIVGIVITADWFIKWPPLQSLTSDIINFQIIMTAFMMGYASVNLLMIHSRRIKRNLSENKYFEVLVSLLLLGCLIVWTAIGVGLGRKSPEYQWLYNNFNLPLGSTAYAATLFYLASATYRVLRARTVETTILLVVGIFIIMANMPLFVAIWPGFLTVRTWISDVIVKSSYRAIQIGVGLGGILMAVRTLLAMETGYLGAVEE